jgi:hypothetical protein
MPYMINPQNGIDLMNNNSIINRILFVVTVFQQFFRIMVRDNTKEVVVYYSRYMGIKETLMTMTMVGAMSIMDH